MSRSSSQEALARTLDRAERPASNPRPPVSGKPQRVYAGVRRGWVIVSDEQPVKRVREGQ